MNTVLAPVRAAKSLVQTVLLLAIAVFIGLAYPVIQFCNGEPLTLFSFVVPALTLLIIFTFFYTPYYTIFAVFVGGFTIAAIAANIELSKYGVCFLIFALFAFGILLKFIRNHIRYGGWDFWDFWAYEWKLWRSSKRRPTTKTALVKQSKP